MVSKYKYIKPRVNGISGDITQINNFTRRDCDVFNHLIGLFLTVKDIEEFLKQVIKIHFINIFAILGQFPCFLNKLILILTISLPWHNRHMIEIQHKYVRFDTFLIYNISKCA